MTAVAARPAADANNKGPELRGIEPATAATADACPDGIELNLSFNAGPFISGLLSALGRFRPIKRLSPALSNPATEADNVDFKRKRWACSFFAVLDTQVGL